MNWGITGDSQITTISTNDDIDLSITENQDYFIFNQLQPFFYRQSHDSLTIYTRSEIDFP